MNHCLAVRKPTSIEFECVGTLKENMTSCEYFESAPKSRWECDNFLRDMDGTQLCSCEVAQNNAVMERIL